MPKFRNQYEVMEDSTYLDTFSEDYTHEVSQTEPGLVDDLETVVRRFAAGVPIQTRGGYYEDQKGDSDDLEDFVMTGEDELTDYELAKERLDKVMSEARKQQDKAEEKEPTQ